MGVEYELVNFTKKETVSFLHMEGSKERELAGNPAQAAVVTWYLLKNQGDAIQFVSDTYGEWPFPSGSNLDTANYKDVTLDYIDKLIKQGILVNEGKYYVDEDDPNIYILALRNNWIKY